jgi:hypothetical protein
MDGEAGAEAGPMLTKHEAVGGTGFIVTDDDGKVLATATLAASEPEGPFVAVLLEYLTLRALAASAAPPSPDEASEASDLPSVLALRRPRLPAGATIR